MKNIKKKNLCLDCNNEIPEDSVFCPYCGSKNIKSSYFDSNNNSYKKCINCEAIVPDDAIYCQYCGKKTDVKQAEAAPSFETPAVDTKSKSSKSYFIPFVLVTVLCLLLGISWYYSSSSKKSETVDNRINEIRKLVKETETSDDFRANKTILYKPTYEKVTMYADLGGPGSIYYEASSDDITAAWDEQWDGNNVNLTITYTKTGVEYLRIYNDVNSEEFYIILVG